MGGGGCFRGKGYECYEAPIGSHITKEPFFFFPRDKIKGSKKTRGDFVSDIATQFTADRWSSLQSAVSEEANRCVVLRAEIQKGRPALPVHVMPPGATAPRHTTTQPFLPLSFYRRGCGKRYWQPGQFVLQHVVVDTSRRVQRSIARWPDTGRVGWSRFRANDWGEEWG